MVKSQEKQEGFKVSNPACKELRSCNSLLTTNKKLTELKKKEKKPLLQSVKEVKSRGKPCPPNWRQTGRYRESQLNQAEDHEQKPQRESVPTQENLNCN